MKKHRENMTKRESKSYDTDTSLTPFRRFFQSTRDSTLKTAVNRPNDKINNLIEKDRNNGLNSLKIVQKKLFSCRIKKKINNNHTSIPLLTVNNIIAYIISKDKTECFDNSYENQFSTKSSLASPNNFKVVKDTVNNVLPMSHEPLPEIQPFVIYNIIQNFKIKNALLRQYLQLCF